MTAEAQPDLFAVFPATEGNDEVAATLPLPKRVRKVIDALKEVLRAAPTSLVSGYSGGKDSTVVASLMFAALAEAREEGWLREDIPHVVVSANTLVENPRIAQHLTRQHRAMRAFAGDHGLTIHAEMVSPSLASSFQVSVLGGRRMMPVFGMSAGCSKDWKIDACQRRLKALQKTFPEDVRVVTLLGSRHDEGTRRSNNLTKQGAQEGCRVTQHDGKWLCYPVIDFTTEDIFDYLLMSSRYGEGVVFPTYCENQADVLKIYSDSMGGGCSLMASDTPASGLQTCSARTGCFVCQMNGEEDASLANMVEKDAPHLKPLVAFRQYLKKISSDAMNRNFVGTLPSRHEAGTVEGGPTGYAGRVLLDMVRILLTIDADEATRAEMAGEEPAFQVLTPQHILAIDYSWAIRGLQRRPFEALRSWVNVYEKGKRYAIPEVIPIMKQVPPTSRIPVPEGDMPISGSLVTPIMEMCDVSIGTEKTFEVDEEGAELLLALDADYLLAKSGPPELAASVLTGYGTVKCCQNQRNETDRRLTMVARLREAGLLEAAYEGGPVQEVMMDDSLFSEAHTA